MCVGTCVWGPLCGDLCGGTCVWGPVCGGTYNICGYVWGGPV